MKIRNHQPIGKPTSAASGIRKRDEGAFRELLEAGLTDTAQVNGSDSATASSDSAAQGQSSDAMMAHALEVLDKILDRIEHEGAPDEHDLTALQSLREELRGTLGKHLPEPVRRDADAMLAVESERMKRPW